MSGYMRYHEIVGMTVVDADGARVGRVVDLAAAPRAGKLVVTDLLVGPAAWFRRVSSRHNLLVRVAPPRRVPWSLVAKVGDRIELCVTSDRLPTPGDEPARVRGEPAVWEPGE